jgi:GNAT superfamily N-acetyltransferase
VRSAPPSGPSDRLATTDYLLRRPRPADRTGLAALASSLWDAGQAGLFSDRWWWNGDEPHCWIAEHVPSGDMAAICAQRRTEFVLRGRPERAATVSDWYVAPGHRGSGLGQALVEKGEEAPTFMYTTAISESAAVGFGRLGWGGDRTIPMSAGIVPVARAIGRRPSAGVEIEHRSVAAGSGDLTPVDEVWAGLRWTDPAMMVRDAAHLRQHLALAGGRRYSLLIAHRRGRPIGYLLHRTLPRHALRAFGPARVGIVSDYLVDEGDVGTLQALVADACRRWSAERVKVGLALCGRDSHRRAMTGLGLLHPVRVGGRLLGRRMSSRAMHQPKPGVEGRWHLTFADNDTDLILGAGWGDGRRA